jgi:myo-inositol-1(or 4)-monophosphatase
MNNLDEAALREVLESTAVSAGVFAREKQVSSYEKRLKSDGSIVTDIDIQCEELIRKQLDESEFEFPVLGEEKGEVDDDIDSYWVVDPIDGTRNFADGHTLFGVSIGLVLDGRIKAGCIYKPATDELFTSIDGGGFYLNNSRSTVSDRSTPEGAHYGITGTCRPNDSQCNRYTYAERLPSKRVKEIGCAVLTLAYVADGRIDGCIVGSLSPWDVLAGISLIREAGGEIRAITAPDETNPQVEQLSQGDFIAYNGNENIKETLLDALTH